MKHRQQQRRPGAGRCSAVLRLLLLSAGLLCGVTALRAGTAAPEDDGDPVMDRQLAMQQLDRNSEALGKVLAGLEPATKLAFYAKAVASDARDVRSAFSRQVPGGNTKPEAWSNWPDFSRRMDEFVEQTGHMAEVSETGDVSAVGELAVRALACRECHQLYRAKKK